MPIPRSGFVATLCALTATVMGRSPVTLRVVYAKEGAVNEAQTLWTDGGPDQWLAVDALLIVWCSTTTGP